MFGNCIKLFFMSMIPIWELRGSIIASQAMNPVVPIVLAYAVCVIGNMIPVPFIYVFARRFLKWGVHKKGIGKPCRWILKKGHNGSKKLGKKGTGGVFVALMIFVGIPLPGTGAWRYTCSQLSGIWFKENIPCDFMRCTNGRRNNDNHYSCRT